MVNGNWRIRSYICSQKKAITEDIDPNKNKFCSSCLIFHRKNFRRLYQLALKNEMNTTKQKQSYSKLLRENEEVKRKLRNAKQNLDRAVEIEVSEWEAEEVKLGRCKLYGNLKNPRIKKNIQSCLSLVEKIILQTNDNNPNDPEIAKVLYMLKTSLGNI